MKALRFLPLLAALVLVAGCSDNPVDSGTFDEGVRTSPNRGTKPRSAFDQATADLGGSSTTPLSLNGDNCTVFPAEAVTITYTITGRQAASASFEVNTKWTYDGAGFVGSNPQVVNVPARAAGDLATIRTVDISVENGTTGGTGTSSFTIETFNRVTTAPAALNFDESAVDIYVSFNACTSANTPPVLVLPNIPDVEATSSAGAVVNFAVTASDAQDGDLTSAVSCDYASGDTFPLGETTVNCEVTDLGGLKTTGSFTITVVDTTPPVVSVTGVEGGVTYTLGSVPEAGCSTTDSASGVATEASLSLSGGPLGAITASCGGAADEAGNAQDPDPESVTYSIIYNWNGFFRPVDNLPMVNSVKAGSAIPVKFSLNGNQGLNVFAMGYPKSAPIACDATAPVDGIEETVTAGSSSLSYDAATDQYNYVWKSEKLWSGCRQLIVKLNDGTEHKANFKFLK